jgi:hypothetical protein
MMHRSPAIALLLFLMGFSLVFAGCITPRIADTHNTTVALQSFNVWSDQQKKFDQQVRLTIGQIGNHLNAYNAGIAQDQPDLGNLRGNVAADRLLLDQWGTQLTVLNAATAQFSATTSGLTYGNSPTTNGTIQLLTQYMKIYTIDMGNAQQHLIDYTNNAGTYIGPDDPAYWDDVYLARAMDAKMLANQSIADADHALSEINANAQRLQQLQ